MNPIKEEETEQRIPLTVDSLKVHNDDNSQIPFADDNSQESNSQSPSRKVSLSSRRNVDLTIEIHQNQNSNTKFNGGDADDAPNTASDESIVIETPPLPLPRSLRRNSISMPQGLNAIEDLEALRLKHQMQEQEPVTEEEKSRTESVSLFFLPFYEKIIIVLLMGMEEFHFRKILLLFLATGFRFLR